MSIKKISFLILIVLIFITVFFLFFNKKQAPEEQEQVVLTKVLEISRKYLSLRYQTDNVLINAKEYSGYEAWNLEMSDIIMQWDELGKEAANLQKLADEMSNQTISLKLIKPVLAYDKQEISDIFDRAPAGKKIATLANFLGVDAKKAYQILKQDQAQVEADAWNEAGDTFQVLESSAAIIKDACKVGGFVGTVILTGGTAAIASSGVLGQAAVLVSGADLVLEVSDDAAKIALGNNNKVSQIIGDARVITEPASAILMISTLPQNLTKGIDKLNMIAFGADQFNSSAQEGKIIGIKLQDFKNNKEVGDKKAEVSVLDKEEINAWLKDQGIDNSLETKEDLENILGIGEVADSKETNNKTVTETKEVEPDKQVKANIDTSDLEGVWEGLLKYTPSAEADEISMEYLIALNTNGTVDPAGNGSVFSTWAQEGNSIKLFMKENSNAYFEFVLSGNTLNFVKLAGPNSEGEWQDDFAGEDFFGGKFYQISLQRQ